MKLRNTILFSAFTIPPILLVCLIVFVPRNKLSTVNFDSDQSKIIDKWASYKYEPVPSKDTLFSEVSRLPIRSKGFELAYNQQQELANAAYNFITAYSSNNYESYLKFALPITNGLYDKGMIDFRKSLLETTKYKKQEILDRAEPQLIMRYYWELWTSSTFDRSFMGEEDRNGIVQNMIKQISWVPSGWYLVEDQRAINSADKFIVGTENVGASTQRNPFTFRPSQADMIAKNGKIQYAYLEIYADNKADFPMPIVVMFYWSEDPGLWLPISIGRPFSPKRKSDFLF